MAELQRQTGVAAYLVSLSDFAVSHAKSEHPRRFYKKKKVYYLLQVLVNIIKKIAKHILLSGGPY